MRLLPRLPPQLGSAQGWERGHLPIGKTSQIYAAPQPECRREPVSVVPEAAGSCLPGVPLRVQDSRRAVCRPAALGAAASALSTCLRGGCSGALRGGRDGPLEQSAAGSREEGGFTPGAPAPGAARPPRAPARGGTAAPASPSFRSLLSRTRVTGQPSVTPPAIWESTRSPRVPCLSLRES